MEREVESRASGMNRVEDAREMKQKKILSVVNDQFNSVWSVPMFVLESIPACVMSLVKTLNL